MVSLSAVIYLTVFHSVELTRQISSNLVHTIFRTLSFENYMEKMNFLCSLSSFLFTIISTEGAVQCDHGLLV
jgi:hypothetical protein